MVLLHILKLDADIMVESFRKNLNIKKPPWSLK